MLLEPPGADLPCKAGQPLGDPLYRPGLIYPDPAGGQPGLFKLWGGLKRTTVHSRVPPWARIAIGVLKTGWPKVPQPQL